MAIRRWATTLDWINALALWVLLGLSSATYLAHGPGSRLPGPPPTIEGMALYLYFGYAEIPLGAPAIALLWCIAAAVTGLLWVGMISFTAPHVGLRINFWTGALVPFAVATLPLAIPTAYSLFVAGGMFAFRPGDAWLAVSRGVMPDWDWARIAYVGAGFCTVLLQIWAYVRMYGGPIARSAFHIVVAALFLWTISAGLGAMSRSAWQWLAAATA